MSLVIKEVSNGQWTEPVARLSLQKSILLKNQGRNVIVERYTRNKRRYNEHLVGDIK